MLPVQDCSRTYGGATRMMRIAITPDRVELALGAAIGRPDGAAPYLAGLHTLSAAGPVTLFDVKRIDLSLRGIALEAAREIGKLRRRLAR